MRPARWFSSYFCNRNTTSQLQEYSVISELPEAVKNIQSFTNGIRAKIGILILYSDSDGVYLEQFVHNIKSQEYLLDIIVRYVVNNILERKLYTTST
jgi:hypothetical protein